MSHKKYAVTYKFKHHENGVSSKEIPKEHGACDAVIIGSILLPEDGSYSQMVYGFNGKTGVAVTDAELFKFWAMLAAQLADSESLGSGRKEICRSVHELITDIVMQGRKPHA